MPPSEKWIKENPEAAVYLAVLHEVETEWKREPNRGARARRRHKRRGQAWFEAFRSLTKKETE